jgi:hypothetical protein
MTHQCISCAFLKKYVILRFLKGISLHIMSLINVIFLAPNKEIVKQDIIK